MPFIPAVMALRHHDPRKVAPLIGGSVASAAAWSSCPADARMINRICSRKVYAQFVATSRRGLRSLAAEVTSRCSLPLPRPPLLRRARPRTSWQPFLQLEWQISADRMLRPLRQLLRQRCRVPYDYRDLQRKPGTATSHFNDVDTADNTRLGLFQFAWGGQRIADLRDPAHPIEVAYYKPGDFCGSYVHYVRETSQTWFACADSGFRVIDLAPKLRASIIKRPG
jgi:hypothetical protein